MHPLPLAPAFGCLWIEVIKLYVVKICRNAVNVNILGVQRMLNVCKKLRHLEVKQIVVLHHYVSLTVLYRVYCCNLHRHLVHITTYLFRCKIDRPQPLCGRFCISVPLLAVQKV